MPNEFVGTEQQVRGLNNASWGAVAVIIRNGVPDRVVTPGSRFGRGWRAPLMGAVTSVPIQTDAVPFGFEITEVLTSDGYQVGLTLNTLIRINEVSDYVYLAQFVRQNGRNFADALIQEVQRGLEAWVSGRISAVAHTDLRRRSMTSVLNKDMPFAFGSQTLKIISFTVSQQRWDPKAIELENTYKDAPIQLAAAANEEEVSSYRLAIFGPLAKQLGVTPAELAFPERHQISQQNAKELALELLKPYNRTLWQRDPSLLVNLFSTAGISLPNGASSDHRLTAPQPNGGLAAERTQILGPHAEDEELNVDKRLCRVWLSVHDTAPFGIAAGRTSREATVLVVRDQSLPVETLDPAAFAGQFGDLPVRVFGLKAGALVELLDRWFSAVSSATDISITADVDDEEVLTVRLNGPAGRAREAMKRLDDPADSAVPALEALLSYAGIRVAIGSA